MKIRKEIFSVFREINFRTEQTSFFQFKRAYQFIFQIFKLFICGFDHLRYKVLCTRPLYHLSFIIEKYFRKQIGMSIYHTDNCF